MKTDEEKLIIDIKVTVSKRANSVTRGDQPVLNQIATTLYNTTRYQRTDDMWRGDGDFSGIVFSGPKQYPVPFSAKFVMVVHQKSRFAILGTDQDFQVHSSNDTGVVTLCDDLDTFKIKVEQGKAFTQELPI